MPQPQVFTFSRSDADILKELNRVFSYGQGTAREQWSVQAELLVEPVGWDALWKLSKSFCKKFDERFPCVAYVSVLSVDFENLAANVEVLSVQHETASVPENVDDVPLIELWPTEKQREQCVNADVTADFIDLLRFYYNNIWMPWDDQDDKAVVPKTIEMRMQLWSDLHNGTIPSFLGRSITFLRNRAVYVHEKLKELDSSLCEGDMTDEDDSLLPPNYLYNCAELNVRLDGLMSQWTLYEDPTIREQWLARMKNKWQKNRSKKNVVALWEGGNMFELEELSQFLRSKLNTEQNVCIMTSAEEGFALEPEEVIVCSKEYEIPEMAMSRISLCSFKRSTLQASDVRSCLLLLSEECTLRDLWLQCTKVNTVLVMRSGELTINNCMFSDDSSKSQQSDFAQGVLAMSGAKISIVDCSFDNFYTGLVVHRGAKVELRNCVIRKCGVGIQMYSGSQVTLYNTAISECSEQSIRCEVERSANSLKGKSIEGLNIHSNCAIGSGDAQKEILVVPQDFNLI